MEAPPPPSTTSPKRSSIISDRLRVSDMEVHPEDLTSSAFWDLDYLLDITLDDQLTSFNDFGQSSQLSQTHEFNPRLEQQPQQLESTIAAVSTSTKSKNKANRVRKRDPRLSCSNFIAGRVPCACPEIDEKLAELEESSLSGKKRVRTSRGFSGVERCQVPGCETDISELKGYHKRHRVCLRCAIATTVVLDGEEKRYCQQCGKFHILPDFDEGKRSCRRKLERHNRRRRKPVDSRAEEEKEVSVVMQNEDLNHDIEAGKDDLYISSPIAEKIVPLENEKCQVTTMCSPPDTQNVHGDSVVSFAASGEIHINVGKDNSNNSISPSYCNKSDYSSVCPTGRISFKLYDWNPAEFPRRLRHQIFHWLASMPVDLEGYIRPGCTILTLYIAMPKFMWRNLLEDPISYLHKLVLSRESMLSRRGSMLVYLNDQIFGVIRDGSSVTKVNVAVQAPKLHHVHPLHFEAGKPMEFVVCGSNLLQPKFRLLVSFSGKYLEHDYSVTSPNDQTVDTCCSPGHQQYKITVPHTEANLYGPAFVEVENESGLSNFIPLLIANREICGEMKMIQQRICPSLLSDGFASATSFCEPCEASALRRATYFDLLLDVAWLLKMPTAESFIRTSTATKIQRLCCLLDFFANNDSAAVLASVLQNLSFLTANMDYNDVDEIVNHVDKNLLLKHMNYARDVLFRKRRNDITLEFNVGNFEAEGYKTSQSFSKNILSAIQVIYQKSLDKPNGKLRLLASYTSTSKIETMLPTERDREIIMNVNLVEDSPKKSCRQYLRRGGLSSRPTVFVIASVAVCLGLCAALLHPHKVGDFAVTIRRCLFD